MKRSTSPSQLSRIYLGGSSVRSSARQTSPMLSPQRTGDHSTSTSWSVSLFSSRAVRVEVLPVVTKPQCSQPDSVLTVQDALMRVSQSQSTQDGASGSSGSDMSQQMLIEALPPVLVLHLKRFRYDEAAGGVIKISKPVQFSPELEIPFGTLFYFHPCGSRD
jgi:hypothetical protein